MAHEPTSNTRTLKISRSRHRVQVVHSRAGQPVEEVAHSAAVRELTGGLRRGGLVGHHSLAGHPHLSAAGRAARKELEDSGAQVPGERRVAVLGTAGIANAGLRAVFGTPDPPLVSELAGRRARKNATRRTYGDTPPDPPMPGYPGISGRW